MMGVLNHLSTLLLLSLLPPALSHVVKRFDPQCQEFFMNGTTPNLPGVLVGGTVQKQKRYKLICQKYNRLYRFATLYDTINRIPVFSAYTFTGNVVGSKRPTNQTWMIEPQLEYLNGQHMEVDNKDFTHNHQAVDTDYKNNRLGLDRGHLFPCSYAPDDAAKRSTFTLTNAVPQASSFNNGSWNRMEGRVRKSLELNCKNNNKIEAYVVTGAVPSFNNTLKERVNIPSHLWTAFCCYNSEKDKWIAGAYWGENKKEPEKKVLDPITLAKLYEKLLKELKEHYHGDGVVEVFPDQCLEDEEIPGELLKDKDKKDKKNKKSKKTHCQDILKQKGDDVQGIPNKRRKLVVEL